MWNTVNILEAAASAFNKSFINCICYGVNESACLFLTAEEASSGPIISSNSTTRDPIEHQSHLY